MCRLPKKALKRITVAGVNCVYILSHQEDDDGLLNRVYMCFVRVEAVLIAIFHVTRTEPESHHIGARVQSKRPG